MKTKETTNGHEIDSEHAARGCVRCGQNGPWILTNRCPGATLMGVGRGDARAELQRCASRARVLLPAAESELEKTYAAVNDARERVRSLKTVIEAAEAVERGSL